MIERGRGGRGMRNIGGSRMGRGGSQMQSRGIQRRRFDTPYRSGG